MNVYCDTSALIKLWVTEEHALRFRRVAQHAEQLATSALSHVELRSALCRLRREGRIEAGQVEGLLRSVEETFEAVVVISLAPPILDLAADMVCQHGLKALDGLQLATASTLQRTQPNAGWVFATFDRRLARAAAAEGFGVTP